MATSRPGIFPNDSEDSESGLSTSEIPAKSAQPSYMILPRTDTGPLYELATAFWGAQLRFNSYRHGNALVDFDSLWPTGEELPRAVEDFKQTQLEYCVLDCCRLAVMCGPVRVLRAMLDARVVGVDQAFQPHGVTLLHMACVAQSPDTVKMLLEFQPNWKRDLKSRSVRELCQDPLTRDRFPAARKVEDALKWRRPQSRNFPTDKSEIFIMASEPMKFVEVLIRLQNMDPVLDLNSERNEDGDKLVHVATACGLPQMALLLALHRLYSVDFNITNRAGLTPLCIATQAGELYLVELLICVLGADPNMANPVTGCTPLHYAARECNPTIISTLIKRGALVNIENKKMLRADDVVPADNPNCTECVLLIETERVDRMNRLTGKARLGTLYREDLHESDLYSVNEHGNTLLMEAALNDRSAMVTLICQQAPKPSSTEKHERPKLVNAQHPKSGRTALALCAESGCAGSLQQLLKFGANPQITDMDDILPLHLACRQGHSDCVEQLLKPIKGLVSLCKARTLTNDSQITELLDKAHTRRQREVVKTLLFECVEDQGDFERLGAFVWEDDDDVNCLNKDKDWPLYLAAQHGNAKIVEFLFNLGGKVTKTHDITHSTPLHAASSGGHFAVVKYLVEFTTSSSARLAGLDAQRLSCSRGQPLVDINLRNAFGHTALELAVSQGKRSVVDLLCHPRYGASCTILDSGGQELSTTQFPGVQLSLDTARQQHMQRIVKLFHERKDLDALKQLWMSPHDHLLSDSSGNSPLMVACESLAHIEVIRFLLSDIIPKSQPIPKRDRDSSDSLSTPKTSTTFTPKASTPSDLGFSPPESQRFPTPIPKSFFNGTASRRDRSSTPYKKRSTDSRISHLEPVQEAPSDKHVKRQLFSPVSDSEASSGGKTASENGHLTASSDSFSSVEVLSVDEQDQAPSQGSDSEDSTSDLSLPASIKEYWNEPQNDLLFRQNRKGFTALHCAIKANHSKAVAAIIKADPRIVNVADHFDNTPIHLAAAEHQKDIANMLLAVPTICLDLENKDRKMAEDLAPRRIATLIRSVRGKRERSSRKSSKQSIRSDSSSPPRSPHDMVTPVTLGQPELEDSLMDVSLLQDRFEELVQNGQSGGPSTPKTPGNTQK